VQTFVASLAVRFRDQHFEVSPVSLGLLLKEEEPHIVWALGVAGFLLLFKSCVYHSNDFYNVGKMGIYWINFHPL